MILLKVLIFFDCAKITLSKSILFYGGIMMPDKSVLDKLQDSASSLTNKQKQLGSYIIANYRIAAFMNLRDLARNAGVSESTVIRLVSNMGYSRFFDFQKALQEVIRKHISNLETLEKYEVPEGKKRGILHDVVALEQSIISEMLDKIDIEVFDRAVELLFSKKYIVLLGSGGDEVVVNYASKFLRLFRDGIIDLSIYDDIKLVHCMNTCTRENAVVLAYSSPRYYKRALNLASDLRDKNIEIIGVTDSGLSPLAALSDLLFVTPMRYITMIDPLCPMMALTHALITGLVAKNPEKARERIAIYYGYTKRRDLCVRNDIAININLNE
ncbi:MAG: MurR/RpiR family transcriptional regulator [Synergistaceae bacterium]|nr:MurR/RpiR family transcriptional regulator [Synergistaceae bacterium]